MSMQTTSDNAAGEPMLDINVTPLIDVMLVLLIMLIMTIPPQTHAVKLDLPVNQPNQPPPPIQPLKNTVGVTAGGAITWNGTPISQDQLRAYLETTQQMNPIPELHLQPDATDHQEGARPEDGLRRERILPERLLGLGSGRCFKGGPSGPPFSCPKDTGARRSAMPFVGA
jgi:biopolymer transport protein ExbD